MVKKSNFYDVIVVGGGPSGSQVACKLAELGYSIGVVEKKAAGGNICCTGIISQECVERYSIPESVIYRRVNSAKIFSPSKTILHIERDEPQAAVIDRAGFNRLWAEKARNAGAEYLNNCNLVDITYDINGIKAEINHQGDWFTLKSRAAVVATGFGAQLLDNLNIGGAGDFAMGVQAEVETRDIDETEVYFGRETAPDFFAWLVPTSEGKGLAGLLTRSSSTVYLKKLLASLSKSGKIVSDDVKLTYSGVSLKPLSNTYSDNVLVVGTAAGQVKPITGGGIYFGLLCADMAANTLHRALKEDSLSAKSLAGYQRAWKRKLSGELTNGYRARKVYEMLSDQNVNRLFRLLETTGIIEELRQDTSLTFDWHDGVIKKMMGQKMISKVLGSIGNPFEKKEKAATKTKQKE